MDEVKVTEGQGEVDWDAHLAARDACGQSVAAYCREHGLKEHQFHYRRTRQRRAKQGSAFELIGAQGSGVVLSRGSWRIEVGAGFDRDVLRSVYEALA
jgi:hypothetical protein